ncbi:MAG: hypothetical protein OJF51_004941 [Nitrospira sp.]|jgi:hypothetical protein|nr:MAG: hypothetical protein OJF51_004941 [Nitrospira sp.]
MQDRIKQGVKWAWARLRDFNDVRDLFELLGLKTAFVAMLGGLGSYAWLYEPGNRPLAVIAICLIVIAICIVSIASQKQLSAVDGSSWYKRWFLGENEAPKPQSEFILLRDAAIKAYTESHARGGGLARRAEKMSGLAPDYTIIRGDEIQILNWVAGDIASKITLFGVRPPAINPERLEYPVKHYSIQDGAVTLRHFLYGEQGYYTNLSVRTNELHKFLEELAKNDP